MNILIASNRGGSGKTTVAINLAYLYARARKSTVLVDFDPQGNTRIGVGQFRLTRTLYSSLFAKGNASVALNPINKHLYYMGNDLDAATIELDCSLRNKADWTAIIKELSKYDVCIFDTSPTMCYWLGQAIMLADYALIPVLNDSSSLQGMNNILQFFDTINDKLLNNYSILINKYDPRTIYAQHISSELESQYKDKILKTRIRRNIKIAEAFHEGIELQIHDKNCNGAKDFVALFKELKTHMKI